MNLWALLGIVLIAYGIMCCFIAFKKPAKVWEIAKIRGFRKVLGEKGAVVFFYVWGLLALVIGVWAMTL